MKNLLKTCLILFAISLLHVQSKAQVQCMYVVTNNLKCDVEVTVQWKDCGGNICGTFTQNIARLGGWWTFPCPMPACGGPLCDVTVTVNKYGTPPTTAITGLLDTFSSGGPGASVSLPITCSGSSSGTVWAQATSATINP